MTQFPGAPISADEGSQPAPHRRARLSAPSITAIFRSMAGMDIVPRPTDLLSSVPSSGS